MDAKGANADARIAGVAARQHGVVTRAQLEALGVGRGAIASRVRRGRLHRVHRGVYAVGHPPVSDEATWMAAVLACGEGAVLSHGSAAALWGLLPASKLVGPVHVSLPSQSGRRRREGIAVHRTTFAPGELTRRAAIPLTSPDRTLRDSRRTLEPSLFRQALREAQHRRYRLDARLGTDRTRSDLEQDFRAFVHRHRLPPAEINVAVRDRRRGRTYTVDFLWRSRRLVVETDSYEYHHGLVAFEDDHERDLALRRLGLTVLRYTGRQLEKEGDLVAAEIERHVRFERLLRR